MHVVSLGSHVAICIQVNSTDMMSKHPHVMNVHFKPSMQVVTKSPVHISIIDFTYY